MIDSVDLIIIGLNYIDFKYLRSKGITIKQYRRNRNAGCFLAYTFDYKNLHFTFVPLLKYLIIKTHADIVLGKDIITISDKEIYKDRVLEIVKEVISDFNFTLEIDRIDYKVDLQFSKKEKVQAYNDILTHCKKNFYYAKKKEQYDTSTYNK